MIPTFRRVDIECGVKVYSDFPHKESLNDGAYVPAEQSEEKQEIWFPITNELKERQARLEEATPQGENKTLHCR